MIHERRLKKLRKINKKLGKNTKAHSQMVSFDQIRLDQRVNRNQKVKKKKAAQPLNQKESRSKQQITSQKRPQESLKCQLNNSSSRIRQGNLFLKENLRIHQ